MPPADAEALAPGTVVVDAMGGDHGPAAVLAGARTAADSGIPVAVVATDDVDTGDLPTLRCRSVVGMAEDPAIALRRHPEGSIRVAAAALRDHPDRSLVSAGTSGATVGATLPALGRSGGMRRPAIAARLPIGAHGVVLVDAGADPDPEPDALLAAVPSALAYSRALGVAAPKIGVLNVGHEPGKGNALARHLSSGLADHPAMAGNVEPAHVLGGDVDVVLTDGFTGNIMLKAIEAAGDDGGGDRAAVVLGVAGTVLVAHGTATAEDLAEAITLASRVTAAGLMTMIAAGSHDR